MATITIIILLVSIVLAITFWFTKKPEKLTGFFESLAAIGSVIAIFLLIDQIDQSKLQSKEEKAQWRDSQLPNVFCKIQDCLVQIDSVTNSAIFKEYDDQTASSFLTQNTITAFSLSLTNAGTGPLTRLRVTWPLYGVWDRPYLLSGESTKILIPNNFEESILKSINLGKTKDTAEIFLSFKNTFRETGNLTLQVFRSFEYNFGTWGTHVAMDISSGVTTYGKAAKQTY